MNRNERLLKDGHLGIEPVEFYGPSDHLPDLGNVGVFSNFSAHTVRLVNPWTGLPEVYATGEHRFQAMKAITQEDHDYVAASDNPGQSKKRGRQIHLRSGWGSSYGDLCWYVMTEVTLAKAIQHPEVGIILASTSGRPIWEDSPTDDIWGIRFEGDYRGKNLLGNAWEQVRAIMGMT